MQTAFKDAKERLAALLQKSSFVDAGAINQVMRELPTMNVVNVMAAIRRCENTEQIMQALADTLKSEKNGRKH